MNPIIKKIGGILLESTIVLSVYVALQTYLERKDEKKREETLEKEETEFLEALFPSDDEESIINTGYLAAKTELQEYVEDYLASHDVEIEGFVDTGDEMTLEQADQNLGFEGDRIIFTITDDGEVVSTFFSEEDMKMARDIAASEELILDDVIMDVIQGRYEMIKDMGHLE